MRDGVAAVPAPRARGKTPTASVEPATAPHDGGALSPNCSGARKSGHARAYCLLPPADMAGIVSPFGIVRLYVLRGWTEQDDEPVKHELVLADFQVRSGQAIQREPLRRVRPTRQMP
ncbi:hypothetical protein ABT040_19650 [Streptomyces sp. NPDC002688]|uniref:hypothetical protein n=1 Tax=Streptomyces sp. NPDC002688 TaxID=3154423 RepID=UPI003334667B